MGGLYSEAEIIVKSPHCLIWGAQAIKILQPKATLRAPLIAVDRRLETPTEHRRVPEAARPSRASQASNVGAGGFAHKVERLDRQARQMNLRATRSTKSPSGDSPPGPNSVGGGGLRACAGRLGAFCSARFQPRREGGGRDFLCKAGGRHLAGAPPVGVPSAAILTTAACVNPEMPCPSLQAADHPRTLRATRGAARARHFRLLFTVRTTCRWWCDVERYCRIDGKCLAPTKTNMGTKMKTMNGAAFSRILAVAAGPNARRAPRVRRGMSCTPSAAVRPPRLKWNAPAHRAPAPPAPRGSARLRD